MSTTPHDNDPKQCPEFQRALAADVRRLDAQLREEFRVSMLPPEKLRYSEPHYGN
jgi:hypothetical protein